MNSAGDTPSAAAETTMESVRHLLSELLLSSITARSSFGRWQLIRPKLASLLSALISAPNWPQPYHPLLLDLIPDLLSNLYKLNSLADECCSANSLPTRGKLHVQSDLDMASAAISGHLHHLDLLISSGILDHPSSTVLSQPAPASAKEDVQLFVKDLFIRLQLGGVQVKNKALESLLQLLRDDEKFASVVAEYGNIAFLIQLIDPKSQSSVSGHAVSAVSILAHANDESRRQVTVNGGLGPLLEIIESGSDSMKEKAAIAVEAITADSNARLTYGEVGVLLEACRSGPPSAQPHALGAIRNVAAVTDVSERAALLCEGAIPLLVQLLRSSAGETTQQNAASCLEIFASSGDDFCSQIIRERGLRKLMALIQDSPNYDLVEAALRAIASLSAFPSTAKILSSSVELITRLGTLIKHGIPKSQHLSTYLLANLSIGDRGKGAIASCINSLIRLMESPKPAGLQESASLVLISLLSLKSNSIEFVTNDKSLVRLVHMLDLRNDSVPKKLPVAVISAILDSGSNGCRRRLVDAGAYTYMKKLTEMEVAGAKKAEKRLAGNRLKNILRRTCRETFQVEDGKMCNIRCCNMFSSNYECFNPLPKDSECIFRCSCP